MSWTEHGYRGLKRCWRATVGGVHTVVLRTRRCPSCSARAQRLVHATDWYYYLLCPDCQLVYVGNAPCEDEVLAWYRGQNFQQQRDAFHGSEGTPEEAWDRWLQFKSGVFREIALDTVGRQGKRRLLEIGCGEGLLLQYFRERDWQVRGIELSPSLADRLHRRGMNVSQEPLSNNPDDACYDLILMFHVIEHLRDPFRDLQKVRALLASEGHLVIETPVSRNYACTDHLFFFNASNLTACLAQSGFVPLRSYQYVDGAHPEFTNLCLHCVPREACAAQGEVASCV